MSQESKTYTYNATICHTGDGHIEVPGEVIAKGGQAVKDYLTDRHLVLC